MPACKTAAGCAIEDIATDLDITEICNGFINARHMYACNGVEELYVRNLEHLGILDEPELLNEMEQVYQDKQQLLIDKDKAKRKNKK